MVTTGLPQIHLPGSEKFVSYKNSLQDYCSKSGVALPKYLPEKTDQGLLGTVSFGSNYVKCKVVSTSMKEADAQVAYEALAQLGYLNGQGYIALKRKNVIATDSSKHIEPGTHVPITAKGHLHQLSQQHKLGNPTYNTVAVPHNGSQTGKGFFSTVTVGTASFKSMAIHTKTKEAEQDAAQVALNAAKLLLEAGSTPLNNTSNGTTAKKASTDKPQVSMKNRLQEHCQKQGIAFPIYESQHSEAGKTYSAKVIVSGKQYFGVSFPAKKAAEASAAEVALVSLGILQA